MSQVASDPFGQTLFDIVRAVRLLEERGDLATAAYGEMVFKQLMIEMVLQTRYEENWE